MKTELGFLLELLFEHKLPKEARKLCKERVALVEAAIAAPQQVATKVVRSVQQAAAQEVVAAPPPIQVPARIIGGEVITGEGTRGPRKF